MTFKNLKINPGKGEAVKRGSPRSRHAGLGAGDWPQLVMEPRPIDTCETCSQPVSSIQQPPPFQGQSWPGTPSIQPPPCLQVWRRGQAGVVVRNSAQVSMEHPHVAEQAMSERTGTWGRSPGLWEWLVRGKGKPGLSGRAKQCGPIYRLTLTWLCGSAPCLVDSEGLGSLLLSSIE